MLVQIYPFTINDNAFTLYIKDAPYKIKSYTVINGNTVEMRFETEPTASQATELKTYLALFDNYAQVLMDEELMDKCKKWGRDKVNEFEIRNINRKRQGLMARQELALILEQIHDTHIFICMLEGSLDTLAGYLFGFQEETVNGVTWQAKEPNIPQYVWQEDIDWLKTELLTFLASL